MPDTHNMDDIILPIGRTKHPITVVDNPRKI